jgi:hypothetical protein
MNKYINSLLNFTLAASSRYLDDNVMMTGFALSCQGFVSTTTGACNLYGVWIHFNGSATPHHPLHHHPVPHRTKLGARGVRCQLFLRGTTDSTLPDRSTLFGGVQDGVGVGVGGIRGVVGCVGRYVSGQQCVDTESTWGHASSLILSC